ncbi:hypothetical protein CDAR_480751 [Caerostris darwini]|uniref:Uncharacterized protein n=1 Tax=Caerostris darwini TaxID=1538125 RepID=A0AAV4RY98_9ARAC|nr:hypothetical protein CDAR_480751 [Caerostris darwini]
MTYARVEEWQRTLQVRGGVLLPHSVQESSSNYLPIQRVQPLKKATLFFPADSEMAYLLLLLYPCPGPSQRAPRHNTFGASSNGKYHACARESQQSGSQSGCHQAQNVIHPSSTLHSK